MSAVIKGAIAFGGVAGVAGVSYGVYHNITTKPTYVQTLKGTLLNTEGAEHKDNWKARLKSLKEVKDPATGLLDNLKTLKSKTESDNLWTELRDWCKDIINNSSKEETDNEFKNVQNYCTFSIKEKIGNKAIPESTGNEDPKWGVAHTNLKTIANSELDSTLKANKDKTTADAEVKKAIKEWCTAAYTKPFKGNDNQEFKNASKICVTN